VFPELAREAGILVELWAWIRISFCIACYFPSLGFTLSLVEMKAFFFMSYEVYCEISLGTFPEAGGFLPVEK